MSSRALRKLQREQELQRQVEAAKKAYEEAEDSEDSEDVADPTPASSRPKNAFDMLEDVEDQEESNADEASARAQPESSAKSDNPPSTAPHPTLSSKSKKKKKKTKKKGKSKAEESGEQKEESGDEVDRALKALAAKDGRGATALSGSHTPTWESRATKLLAIDSHNLNPVNEMKSLFGNIVLEDQESRSSPRNQRRREQNQQGGVDLATALTGRYSVASKGKELGALAHRRNVFVQGKEEWPLATSGGLSMEWLKADSESKASSEKQYNIMHNNTYRETQAHFRAAVELMDPQRMIGLLSMYPYHIATLLQVSEIAKHQGDHAVSGDLVERALFSFGKSVHSTFPAALRSGVARVPFNKPANRELYLAIWRCIKNLEMRGTWRTAFEWSKILLQLDPLTDPFGVTLMIDQLALRGRQHAQLIELCSDDAYGQAWDFLPNIQISLALAYLRSNKPRDARSRLAVAMHKYPYILSALASALDISPLPKTLWAKLPSTDAEKLYTELYVARAKDLWNTPETISLLGEVAETLSHYKDAISAAPEAPKLEISLEEARHIMLLETPALIALLPRKFTIMPTSSSDVLPPPDSQSDLVARAPGAGPRGGGDAMQTIFNAAGATAGTAGSLLTRIMNWFTADATAEDPQGESQGQAALRDLQDQLGGDIPPEMIQEWLQMQIEDVEEQDLGEGVTPAGLGLAGGWDYYEEANGANSTPDEDDDEGDDSMPDLESIPDTNTPAEPEPASYPRHAARVEDADEEDEERGSGRPQPSPRAILRHVDSDDEVDISPPPQSPPRSTLPVQPSQPAPQRVPAPQTSSTPATASADEFSDPQRLQRWLLTTGLTDLQSNPGNGESLKQYMKRLKQLPARQQDWIIRMVGQRAGGDVEQKAELTSLISDSKRKYSDVRTAAEQSLSDIKAISVTSETQLAGDLCRKNRFIEPFILACKTKNTKLATAGTVCLQRLTASKAVPRVRLPDVLDAFQEGLSAGYEPQLKILQTLPSLLQLYADDVHGDILASILELCAVLQSSKTAIVSNTAAATFQQLVSSVFENASTGDRLRTSDEHGGRDPNDGNLRANPPDDAQRLFEDFCVLLDHQKPQFLRVDGLPPAFLLESLHTIMSSHGSLLVSQEHHDSSWPRHLLHGLSAILARKDNFGTTVRALSIMLLVLRGRATSLRDQVVPVIPTLIGALEKDTNSPWRRALFLEFFRNLCSDFNVMRQIFTAFDIGKDSARFFGQLMSALVRIASEDPSLIGLGRQSTVPIQRTTDPKSEEAASIEAQGLGGAITTVASADSSTTGISVEWSLVTVPLLDQRDRQTAPVIPSTYIYTLVLGCVASLCDGLSKFVMPLSVPNRVSQREPSEVGHKDSSATAQTDEEPIRKQTKPTLASQKHQRLVNPLTLKGHRLLAQIQVSADIIEACWPAALATCSTFLNAALDSEFYHALIRSVQKLAQVSGVLELSTPRDALLTTLAKSSIPVNASNIIAGFQNAKSGQDGNADQSDLSNGVRSPTEPPPMPTFQITSSPLNVRHLLCLRALLNLGIALGPTLEKDAWFILIETLQTVEALIAMPTSITATSQSASPRIGSPGSEGQSTLATEIAAAQAATKRMLENTRGFNAASFTEIVHAMLRLLGQNGKDTNAELSEQPITSPITPVKLGAPKPGHHMSRSVSGLWTKSKTLEVEIGFVLNKLSELSRINISRFASSVEQECSWTLIGGRLLRLSQDASISVTHRIHAASIIDLISMEAVKVLDDSRFEAEEADTIRFRCLRALLQQMDTFEETRGGKHESVDMEIHKRLLDALESMLSHSGESLSSCWPIALEILSVTFSKRGQNQPHLGDATIEQAETDAQTAQILRIAFRSIQLIASDFLGVLDDSSLAQLAHLLREFGIQYYDLNVALTSTTLLWSLASHVLSKIDKIDIRALPSRDNEAAKSSPRQAFTSGVIWSDILLELVELCKDKRADVRNAAIRVLLRMLDASSESLSPNTWAVSLKVGPFEIIRYCMLEYGADKTQQMAWMASAAQLTDGIIQLICQHLGAIAEDDGFKDTWLQIMDVLKGILQTRSLSAFALAFSNISQVVSASKILTNLNEEALVEPAVQLWTDYHPASIREELQADGRPVDEQSNQQAFTSHAHVLVEAYKTDPTTVSEILQDRLPAFMDSIERGLMLCTHPPYTSDVKSMAPEQKELCDCLDILRSLLKDEISKYSGFFLRLLTLTLDIQDAKIVFQQKKSSLSKSAQKPTFIAFAAACLDYFRNLILEHADNHDFVRTLTAHDACQVLSAVISTKYTKIPTNNQAPLWRNATVTAVVLLEALRKHASHNRLLQDSSHMGDLAPQIISIAVNILQPGGLSNPPAPEHKQEALLEDEIFDIEHFELLHKAIVPIFDNTDTITEQRCKEYAIVLFKASLLAKPWFYDIPDDLVNEPLKNLSQVRPGSVHRPVFAVRRQICYAALKALFELVQQGDSSNTERSHTLACAAAPYLILRVVHPFKTLLADQRLRSLTPPPMPQQVEVQVILSKFVDLRSDGYALQKMMSSLDTPNQATGRVNLTGETLRMNDDGKGHLRILYSMMLRVQKFWLGLPRLTGPGARAWQDDEPGRGIHEALERWQRVIAEGTGFQGFE
ncbi:Endocytosis and vacuole integrity protein [Cladophialophora chaetospira]|uniref:Endocytosis and vacuole integrity protein n=1 Tax=Cladophialophora chaetospira TaxID=386627 RepID=A0AA38WVQ6_9EURO|nr:Endocytosis and vacuole integrity protein [Cladophialophora chaetospira]